MKICSVIVLLYIIVSLHKVIAQNFQLQLQLTGYSRGNSIPNPITFTACLRDSSTGCDICSSEEAQSATLDINQASELPNTDPLIFPPTMAGGYLVCLEIREENEVLIDSSSTVVSITMTGGPDMRSFTRGGGGPQRVAITYELQVQCSENYFSPTCSTLCTLSDTSSGDFECSGESGEVMICQPAVGGGPDLANCQNVAMTTSAATTDDRGGETTASSTNGNSNEMTTPSTSGNSNEMTTSSNEMTTPSTSGNSNEMTTSSTFGNSIDGSAGGLSQGEVAGIIVPILFIIALVALGTVVGILLWQYQPWHNILNKKGANDALENPVYNEMELGGGRPGHNQELSASTYSSPLYSDASADASEDTAGRNKYTENGNLMDIIRMQSAKKKNNRVQHPAEANGAVVVPPKKEAVSSDDHQGDYEPVEVSPAPTFDNPDYEAV